MLRFISDKFPLPELHHLKRIKRDKTEGGTNHMLLLRFWLSHTDQLFCGSVRD